MKKQYIEPDIFVTMLNMHDTLLQTSNVRLNPDNVFNEENDAVGARALSLTWEEEDEI